ncbi:MAG: GGDEF domain-containing protein [Alphaproteobacteria bacterium]
MAASPGNDCDTIADKAMALMRARGIPVNPRNFAVWFAYCSGDSSELKMMADRILEMGLAVDEQTHEWLHRAFCSKEFEHRAVVASSEAAEAAMGGVMAQLAKAGTDAEAYGHALGTYEQALAEDPLGQGGANAVKALLAATREMHEVNTRLESQLAAHGMQIGELKSKLEDVRRDSVTDTLTGIANRRAFDDRLKAGIAHAERDGTPLCLLMLDIDHFKKFNDNYGHQVGDEVLKLVARTLTDSVKGRDLPARYGGEEFAIILPDTRLDQAVTVAEHVRAAMASRRIVRRNSGTDYGQVSLSIGISVLGAGDDAEDLVRRADEALYEAKNTGRNRVTTEAAVITPAAAIAAMA